MTIRLIFVQNVGSTPSALAFVMNSNAPDGIIKSSDLRDHGNKCSAKLAKGMFLEKPNNLRSNIKAGPTNMTIPNICMISNIGYSHND